jgi:hypothetical protein
MLSASWAKIVAPAGPPRAMNGESGIPLMYSHDLYVLREHIELARRQMSRSQT